MMTFEDQHREMLDLADGILAAVRRDDPAGRQALAQLRLQLSKEVSKHVSEEVALIQRQPGEHRIAGSEKNALIARYHDELLIWRGQLNKCNVDWPPARIQADRHGFAAAFGPLRNALAKRIRWEEEIFYPSVLSRNHLGRRAA